MTRAFRHAADAPRSTAPRLMPDVRRTRIAAAGYVVIFRDFDKWDSIWRENHEWKVHLGRGRGRSRHHRCHDPCRHRVTAIGVFPPMDQPINDALALLATSYRIVISVGGAWLTARLAPDKPMKHAMILGVVGTVLGLVGVVATWNRGLGPRWYPIALAVLAIPQCWVGGRLYVMRSGKR